MVSQRRRVARGVRQQCEGQGGGGAGGARQGGGGREAIF